MATIRITGVPTTTTKHDLTKSLRARSDCVSLSHHDSHPTSSQTATVTFTSRSTAARLKATKRPPRCLGRRPSVDSDFLGLTVLSSSPDDEVEYAYPSSSAALPNPFTALRKHVVKQHCRSPWSQRSCIRYLDSGRSYVVTRFSSSPAHKNTDYDLWI